MGQIADKMTAAGIKLTLLQRIWMFVKDHPRSTSNQIAAGINVPVSNVTSIVHDGLSRGMLLGEKIFKGKEFKSRQVYAYTAVGETYAFLPRIKHKAEAVKCVCKEMPHMGLNDSRPLVPSTLSIQGETPFDAVGYCAKLSLTECLMLRSYLNEVLK
jgi:hypothetical protein